MDHESRFTVLRRGLLPALIFTVDVVISVIIINSHVVAAAQASEVCIPPGTNGIYNYACNKETWLSSWPDVQREVLVDVKNEFVGMFPAVSICKYGSYGYEDEINGGFVILVNLFSYASCGDGMSEEDCVACLASATNIVRTHCDHNAVGAQAASTECCIRYETSSFC